MTYDRAVAQRLETLLRKECQIYSDFMQLTSEEARFVTKFDAERLTAVTAKRAGLYQEMLIAQDERLEIMRTFPGAEGLRLRELALKFLKPDDAKRILPLIDKLAHLVREAQAQGRKHNQIVSFGLKVVHGILSLFWSATQNVVRAYTRKGSIKESYHPGASRQTTLLKQA